MMSSTVVIVVEPR
jgi:hypothetical protein